MHKGHIASGIFLLSLSVTVVVHAQNTPTRLVNVPADSGLTIIKSRWYRHVVMMSAPPWSAATGSIGAQSATFGGSRRGFMYEAKIKNESTREVKALHWDHVFIDPRTGRELRRFHFFNDRRSIGKGKTATLERMSGHPPSPSIDVGMLEKGAPKYQERIDIKCVLYKGDVFWQAASASNAECSPLRRKIKKAK
jgi:hypothetical protein